MWYTGPTGLALAKGALRICQERGLVGAENMRHDELRTLLSNQPDFASVKPELQEEVERRGHILLFGPKCHPECMHIEMCWAHIKKYCRQHCVGLKPQLELFVRVITGHRRICSAVLSL